MAKHSCSICGKEGEWSNAWEWYGSLVDFDAGLPILKLCSKRCKDKIAGSEDQLLDEIMSGLGMTKAEINACRKGRLAPLKAQHPQKYPF